MLDLRSNVLKPFFKSKILHKDYCSIFKLANTTRYQRWDDFLRETELVISVCMQPFPRKPVEHKNGKYAMVVELVKLFKWGNFLF